MSHFFPKRYEPLKPFVEDINVEVDLSNYATKTDLKNVSNVDVSIFALKSNLDVDKLTPVPNYLAKLSNVVKNDVVERLNMIN